jgi:hypothetical protein
MINRDVPIPREAARGSYNSSAIGRRDFEGVLKPEGG